jgi:hypothetical protein
MIHTNLPTQYVGHAPGEGVPLRPRPTRQRKASVRAVEAAEDNSASVEDDVEMEYA